MHIAVIGAGAAGLCAARYALESNFEVTVFEQYKQLGGVWVYTDETGTNEYGLTIENSMYQGLRTNLPKEIMGYPDCPIDNKEGSFCASKTILKYLNDFAKQFNLFDHIKFDHYVVRVHPKGDKWEIVVNDLKNQKSKTSIFDAVMVCNGHHREPNIPKYDGQDIFEGIQEHSQCYRRPEDFTDHDVLIVGCGFSAMDIIFAAAKTAKSVTISTHNDYNLKETFPTSIDIVPDIAKLTKNSVEFGNGVQKSFSKIMYCTGYLYSFPFLSTHCKIKVDDSYVYPLYKHCFNIENPTMIFPSLLSRTCPFTIMDMQARVFMQYLKGNITLPSKEEMLRDTEEKMQAKWKSGYKKRHSHWFFDLELTEYLDELAEFGKIDKVKPVLLKLYYEHMKNLFNNFGTCRNHNYKLIDDETFIRIK